MKHALLATFLCLGLRAQAPVNDPSITIELRDDATEEVKFRSSVPVSKDLRGALAAAAGCVPGSVVEEWLAPIYARLSCRHAVERSGTIIATSWDFSPIAAALAEAGATNLTTCIDHPDWPFAENDQNLPLQRIPRQIAHCGGWQTQGSGPLHIGIRAGYEAKAAWTLAAAALGFILIFGAAGLLVREQGFLLRHTLTTLWNASCFLWLALILKLDGLRMLSLWLGPTGNSRWLLAGLIAVLPPLAVARIYSLRREPLFLTALRNPLPMAVGGYILATAILCGGPQVDPLDLKAYAIGVPLFLVALRLRPSGNRPFPHDRGDFVARLQSLASKAQIAMPKLMLWQAPPNIHAAAAAVVGRQRMILISTGLLSLCSKREVDAVAAHELAHFVQNRRLMIYVYTLAITASLVAAAFAEQRLQAWAVLPVILCGLLLSVWKRRMEFAADRFSVRLTEDPEAMASSLIRISAANQVPIEGSRLHEIFLSHPWTVKRIQRLGVSLETAQSSPSVPTYSLDSATTDRPMGILTQGLARYFQFLLFRIWIVALAAGVAFHASQIGAVAIFLIATTAGFFAISALWSRYVTQVDAKVRAKLLEIHGPLWAEAAHCGMSPGSGCVVFDSGYMWDTGLIRISGSALCYAGDRASFSVPRSAIGRIALAAGPVIRLRRSKVILIHLKGNPESIALRIATDGAASRRRLEDLFDSLVRWFESEDADAADCGFISYELAPWPAGQIVVARLMSFVTFERYAAICVIPAALAPWIVGGLNWSAQTILPPVVTLALFFVFIGHVVFLRGKIKAPIRR